MSEKFPKTDSDANQILCVCGHCAHHDNSGVHIEINWIDMRMYYKCSDCKKINELDFSLLRPAPYPKTVVRKG